MAENILREVISVFQGRKKWARKDTREVSKGHITEGFACDFIRELDLILLSKGESWRS